MADIVFNWVAMEEDINTGQVGYLHAEKAPFNALKEREPESIWLVRKNSSDFWLMGRLEVTSKRPANFPKAPKKNFIYYKPGGSVFFTDPWRIRTESTALVSTICKEMFERGNGQGFFSATAISSPLQEGKLKHMAKIHEVQSFEDFSGRIKAGTLRKAPYKTVPVRSGRQPDRVSIQPGGSPSAGHGIALANKIEVSVEADLKAPL